jgi:hypothetical protein
MFLGPPPRKYIVDVELLPIAATNVLPIFEEVCVALVVEGSESDVTV